MRNTNSNKQQHCYIYKVYIYIYIYLIYTNISGIVQMTYNEALSINR